MECEASHGHQKRSKHTSSAPFSSTSIQDSSFIFPILPTELINEILVRLPVKSLVKFRLVSKTWLRLISSSDFVKTHINISANNKAYHRLMLGFDRPENNLKGCSVSSLLYDHVTRAIDLDYPPKKSHQTIKIVGSVNGLICVAIEEKDLFIWNPSIRKLTKLPAYRTDCFFSYGFGYDELHDDYKVVGITRSARHIDSPSDVSKIYSLNNNSWSCLDDFQTGIPFMKSGMFVNGKLHWAIATNRFSSYYDNWGIIFVDLADGRWGEIEKPCCGERNSVFMPCLSVLGTDLSMFCSRLCSHLDLWVMKEYGVKESWTKMFTIKYPDDLVGHSMVCPPFCMLIEGEILCRIGSIFMIYNPNDDSMRFRKVTNCNHLVEAKNYIESLVWPFVAEGTRDATTSEPKAQMKTIM
ncbi:F-box/kelch-repeat protein At3g23880-like [Solanum dulcamara]|uniref:F-box/kelch-repeat protein At3g23880-like n=1 Tax=Solanum dulcamara TaxID=45834 RepID=UPI0024860F75|nr:F-box/kelch-repeat protein At3g23880-like [Solanum dulcamara]